MSRSTLDANMLASGAVGFLIEHSTPGQILRAWRDGHFELCLSDHLLAEVRRTPDKPYFQSRLSRDQIDQFLRGLAEQAVIVPLTATVVGVATHPEDDLVLATAISAEAEYLVTGDRQLLRLGSYEGVIIVSPREFLAMLGGL